MSVCKCNKCIHYQKRKQKEKGISFFICDLIDVWYIKNDKTKEIYMSRNCKLTKKKI